MTAKTVLVTTPYIEPGGEVEALLRAARLEVTFGRPQDRKAAGTTLRDAVRGVSAVIAGTELFDAGTIAASDRLEIVARCGAGYDNVDVDAATARGVAVSCTPGANSRSVAEHVLALMLSCARRIPQNMAGLTSGRWEQHQGTELHGSTLGVVGLGSIGKMVAELARGFGMTVLASDVHIDEEFVARTGVVPVRELSVLLAASDFVTIHVALTPETKGMVDARTIGLMKRTAFLINAARGGIVDEPALVEALRAGRLAGAGLDVYEREPLRDDDPLLTLDNVVLTAHIGGATEQARARIGRAAAQTTIDVLENRLGFGVVNPGLALRASLLTGGPADVDA